MNNLGIIFGSDTGMTLKVTNFITEKLEAKQVEVIEVCNVSAGDFQRFDLLLLGLSTWYDGDLQSDWEYFFEEFQTIDFTGQTLAIYGLGDQYGYAEYFIDGVGILAEVILDNGGTLIGAWPIEGYDFTESRALKDEATFFGLAIDEDNQSELTQERLDSWLAQIQAEYLSLYGMGVG
ncbi:MAG: flavodoxin [Bacteroidota bacterium]